MHWWGRKKIQGSQTHIALCCFIMAVVWNDKVARYARRCFINIWCLSVAASKLVHHGNGGSYILILLKDQINSSEGWSSKYANIVLSNETVGPVHSIMSRHRMQEWDGRSWENCACTCRLLHNPCSRGDMGFVQYFFDKIHGMIKRYTGIWDKQVIECGLIVLQD